MATQYTLFRPNTCGCVLIYAWDDAVPLDQRVHTPVARAPVFPRVVDEPATAAARAKAAAARDAAHAEIAAAFGITVDTLREQASRTGVLLPETDTPDPTVYVVDRSAAPIGYTPSKACRVHALHALNASALHAAAIGENQRVMRLRQTAADALGVDPAAVGWQLDAERALTITLPSEASAQGRAAAARAIQAVDRTVRVLP